MTKDQLERAIKNLVLLEQGLIRHVDMLRTYTPAIDHGIWVLGDIAIAYSGESLIPLTRAETFDTMCRLQFLDLGSACLIADATGRTILLEKINESELDFEGTEFGTFSEALPPLFTGESVFGGVSDHGSGSGEMETKVGDNDPAS